MSEMVLPIGDTLTVTTGGEQSFKLPFLDTLFDFWDIAKQYQNASLREFTAAIIAYVHEKTGVAITAGEAQNLYDSMDLEYARKKKERASAIASMLGLPSSTE